MPSKKKSGASPPPDFKFKKDEKVLILPVHTGDDIYEAKVRGSAIRVSLYLIVDWTVSVM